MHNVLMNLPVLPSRRANIEEGIALHDKFIKEQLAKLVAMENALNLQVCITFNPELIRQRNYVTGELKHHVKNIKEARNKLNAFLRSFYQTEPLISKMTCSASGMTIVLNDFRSVQSQNDVRQMANLIRILNTYLLVFKKNNQECQDIALPCVMAINEAKKSLEKDIIVLNQKLATLVPESDWIHTREYLDLLCSFCNSFINITNQYLPELDAQSSINKNVGDVRQMEELVARFTSRYYALAAEQGVTPESLEPLPYSFAQAATPSVPTPITMADVRTPAVQANPGSLSNGHGKLVPGTFYTNGQRQTNVMKQLPPISKQHKQKRARCSIQ